jgi:23S rRNA pseudouridine1911/1915/1917 synthase
MKSRINQIMNDDYNLNQKEYAIDGDEDNKDDSEDINVGDAAHGVPNRRDCIFNQRVVLVSNEAHRRLDVFISTQLGITRSYAQQIIRNSQIISGNVKLKPSSSVSQNQEFVINMPPVESLELTPEYVPFDVIYEDKYIIVVNKPAGIVVHPAPGNWTQTLVHGLLYRYPDMWSCNNTARPGIVHRLDATTSGLMVVARETKSMDRLQKMFQNKEIHKTYIALVSGNLSKTDGVINAPIGRDPKNRHKMAVLRAGRDAVTEFKKLWSNKNYSLVLCRLITGRTHQIRVHFEAIGYPLIGDRLYGNKKANEKISDLNRVFLHSWKLELQHPITEVNMIFRCPIPEELKSTLKTIRAV